MKSKLIIKLFTLILVIILILNIICITNVKARDNYAYAACNSDLGTYAQQAINNANSMYLMLKYNAYSKKDPNKSELWKNLYADVQYFFVHGDWDRIIFPETGILAGSGGMWFGLDHIGTDDVNWDTDTILVTYVGCNTSRDDNYSGISGKTCERGANLVLGFRNKITNIDAMEWSRYYNAALATGYGVYDAAVYANSQSYLYDDDEERCVKNNTLWNHGEANIKIGKYSTNSTTSLLGESIYENNILDENRNILENSKQVIKIKNIEEITDILKKYDQSFNEENYTISENEGFNTINITNGYVEEHKIINFQLKIGDFYTNAGYVATINNGVIEAIYDNTKILKNKETKLSESDFSVSNITKNKIDNYKQIARYETIQKLRRINSLNYNITELTQRFYYNVETGKKYIVISTEVETQEYNNGKSKGIECSLFEI